jgi:cob(I)alamin adenosyltransferase
MKIYTRAGDQGGTGLIGGERVPKCHPRLAAYGTLDELNSILGVLGLDLDPRLEAGEALGRIQRDLFALGSRLATPAGQEARRGPIPTWDIPAMEADIDRLAALAPPLRHFVLPGGRADSAYGHWARTVCRRAEREVVALGQSVPVDPEILVYLNRLSDWLFALARAANGVAGEEDVKWIPGPPAPPPGAAGI